jgi:hypothetical protein
MLICILSAGCRHFQCRSTHVLSTLETVAAFVALQADAEAAMACVTVAAQVRDQDVDLAAEPVTLRRGVAKDRRISVEDADMRRPARPCSTAINVMCCEIWTLV